MVDEKMKKEKIAMWTKKLEQLQKELDEIMVRKGEAAAMGDLSENAAYKDAVEAAETWSARINEVEKILADLEKGGK